MISVVVIEYNSLEDIDKFIKPVMDYFGSDYELIISSNSLYSNDEKERISRQYNFARWVFNKRNGGFAYGMNEGLKVSKGDVFVVMNPDVRPLTSIQTMVRYLKAHKNIGIIAPKIVDEDGVVQDSFRHYITPWRFFLRHIERIKMDNRLSVMNVQQPIQVDWVIGAFMMCRRDFYERVGGLSDAYFMYCEDMDWCKRAHLAGYDVTYFPEAIIKYKGTRSARKSWKYTKIFMKSLFTYWKKYGIR